MIQKINNLLARSIVSLNAILALALVVGPVIGIASAIAVCGGLAVLLDMRKILVEVRDALRDNAQN